MANRARLHLALYLGVMFLSLPLLPSLVLWVTKRVGPERLLLPLAALFLLLFALLIHRLYRRPRPAPPWPQLALAGIALLGLASWSGLASSPIGRVHLAEYGLLGILFLRALPLGNGAAPYAAAVLATAVTGLGDEVVQHFLPNRVFDWYDVALNSAAGLIGVLLAIWWKWTKK